MPYAIIAGGGKIGYFVARALINRNYEVLLLEKDPATYHRASSDLGDVMMLGDACEPTTLRSAGIERADLIIAATGDDADNLVICQMAAHCFGRTRTIARINNPENEPLFERLGVSDRVSSTSAILNLLTEKVERTSIVLMGVLEHSDLEVMEIIVDANSPFVDGSPAEMNLPEGVLIISVLREGKAMVPTATTKFLVDDVLVVLIHADMEATLREFVV